MSTERMAGSACPECAGALRGGARLQSWCPACEWNLGVPDTALPPGRFARWEHRLARRLTDRDYALLQGRPAERPRWDGVLVAAYAAAVAIHLLTVVLLVGGIALIALTFPNPFAIFGGGLAVGIAILLRPRFGRLDPRGHLLTRSGAPAVFALLDDIGKATGTRAPDLVQVVDQLNASMGRVGIRHRPVLTIGVPLWMLLTPAQRVALLAHEFGHAVNGDARHGLVVGSALDSLNHWCDLLRPTRSGGMDGSSVGFVAGVIEFFSKGLLWSFYGVVAGVRLVLARLVLQSGQRAEYYADDISARVASTRAALDMFNVLLVVDTCEFLMGVESRRKEAPDGLIAACAGPLNYPADERDRRRRLSARIEPDLFASHPPTDRRMAMIEARPVRDAQFVLTEADSARIDAELAPHYARVAREIGLARW